MTEVRRLVPLENGHVPNYSQNMFDLVALIWTGVVVAMIVFGGIPKVRQMLNDIKTDASDRAVKADKNESDKTR